MNTFFTVWFVVNGALVANTTDGWMAHDMQTEARCQSALEWNKQNPTQRVVKDEMIFTCEKDASPKKKLTS